jgi:16S rRNA (guanine527-N7)-methyltransferase
MSDNTLLLPQMNDVWQQSLNWQPNSEQQLQFQRLYEQIIAGNKLLNLTRITEPLEFWEKHLWDSLRGIVHLLKEQEQAGGQGSRDAGDKLVFKIIDIGTGAGFPGIPIAIALPNLQVTLLDSTRKKVAFLDTLISQLDIQNVDTAIGRAEIVGKQPQYQQAYDVVAIRAVGSASVCAEYALPFLKPGGFAILYRGNWTADEAETLQAILKKLGGAIEKIEEFLTPLTGSTRHCIYVRKVAVSSI